MAESKPQFPWPAGKRAAVSLTFDDARLSQVDRGLPILDAHGVKATFYVSPGGVEARLDGWRRAVAAGHEIGNHTLTHPCTINFGFSRRDALEDYTLERMEGELDGANETVRRLLGVKPATFAYPCGQTFVGRGEGVQSYVPLVARRFLAARTAYCEVHNDPTVCDFAQASAFEADGKPFSHLKALAERTLAAGGWAIFFGHEVGSGGHQTVVADALNAFCQHAQEPASGIWIDTVVAVARHIAQARA
jgi:peptidoglycan/xylan/chitin deacetylase (PgdA/CDA1 family)